MNKFRFINQIETIPKHVIPHQPVVNKPMLSLWPLCPYITPTTHPLHCTSMHIAHPSPTSIFFQATLFFFSLKVYCCQLANNLFCQKWHLIQETTFFTTNLGVQATDTDTHCFNPIIGIFLQSVQTMDKPLPALFSMRS